MMSDERKHDTRLIVMDARPYPHIISIPLPLFAFAFHHSSLIIHHLPS
jgi:hypothetical protein